MVTKENRPYNPLEDPELSPASAYLPPKKEKEKEEKPKKISKIGALPGDIEDRDIIDERIVQQKRLSRPMGKPPTVPVPELKKPDSEISPASAYLPVEGIIKKTPSKPLYTFDDPDISEVENPFTDIDSKAEQLSEEQEEARQQYLQIFNQQRAFNDKVTELKEMGKKLDEHFKPDEEGKPTKGYSTLLANEVDTKEAIEKDINIYENKVQELNTRIDNYNDEFARLEGRGTWTPDELRELRKEESELNNIDANLEEEDKKLTLRIKYNEDWWKSNHPVLLRVSTLEDDLYNQYAKASAEVDKAFFLVNSNLERYISDSKELTKKGNMLGSLVAKENQALETQNKITKNYYKEKLEEENRIKTGLISPGVTYGEPEKEFLRQQEFPEKLEVKDPYKGLLDEPEKELLRKEFDVREGKPRFDEPERELERLDEPPAKTLEQKIRDREETPIKYSPLGGLISKRLENKTFEITVGDLIPMYYQDPTLTMVPGKGLVSYAPRNTQFVDKSEQWLDKHIGQIEIGDIIDPVVDVGVNVYKTISDEEFRYKNLLALQNYQNLTGEEIKDVIEPPEKKWYRDLGGQSFSPTVGTMFEFTGIPYAYREIKKIPDVVLLKKDLNKDTSITDLDDYGIALITLGGLVPAYGGSLAKRTLLAPGISDEGELKIPWTDKSFSVSSMLNPEGNEGDKWRSVRRTNEFRDTRPFGDIAFASKEGGDIIAKAEAEGKTKGDLSEWYKAVKSGATMETLDEASQGKVDPEYTKAVLGDQWRIGDFLLTMVQLKFVAKTGDGLIKLAKSAGKKGVGGVSYFTKGKQVQLIPDKLLDPVQIANKRFYKSVKAREDYFKNYRKLTDEFEDVLERESGRRKAEFFIPFGRKDYIPGYIAKRMKKNLANKQAKLTQDIRTKIRKDIEERNIL